MRPVRTDYRRICRHPSLSHRLRRMDVPVQISRANKRVRVKFRSNQLLTAFVLLSLQWTMSHGWMQNGAFNRKRRKNVGLFFFEGEFVQQIKARQNKQDKLHTTIVSFETLPTRTSKHLFIMPSIQLFKVSIVSPQFLKAWHYHCGYVRLALILFFVQEANIPWLWILYSLSAAIFHQRWQRYSLFQSSIIFGNTEVNEEGKEMMFSRQKALSRGQYLAVFLFRVRIGCIPWVRACASKERGRGRRFMLHFPA